MPTRLSNAYNNARSRNSGRPVRNCTTTISSVVFVVNELTASTRSNTEGPRSARNSASTIVARIAIVASVNISCPQPDHDPRYPSCPAS